MQINSTGCTKKKQNNILCVTIKMPFSDKMQSLRDIIIVAILNWFVFTFTQVYLGLRHYRLLASGLLVKIFNFDVNFYKKLVASAKVDLGFFGYTVQYNFVYMILEWIGWLRTHHICHTFHTFTILLVKKFLKGACKGFILVIFKPFERV